MTRKLLVILVLAVSFAMLVPGLAFFQNSHSPNAISTPSITSSTPTVSSGVNAISNSTTYKHYFPPNFHPQTKDANGVVSPLYSGSPAPMGVGSWGVTNSSGTLTGYVLNTTSFEGTAVLNNLTTVDLTNDGPDQYTMQLNTILRNVTLFGNSSYVFWNQNVVLYTAHNHTLSFEDNIWNFSSSSYFMGNNTFYSDHGTIQYPTYYYALGPALNVSYPFTVHMFLNSTIVDNRNAVFFNYTVISASGTYTGSFDEAVFNSTYGMPSSFVTPPAYYQINGFKYTPNGFLPYDAELMIGGPGGGSQANVLSINGSMTLDYLPAGSSSHYVSVPSAYDFGTDTGETATGIGEYWSGNTVYLNSGPSLLYPMWNISSNSGYQSLSGSVSPSNSFIFISNGTFNDQYAAWAPVNNDGSFNFMLPPGTYSGKILMSNYVPKNFSFNSSMTMTTSLVKNTAKGIYTPLYAMNNQQLQYISYTGTGTQSNPYRIYNDQYYGIDPLFWEWNDYFFPVFSGILLVNTNAYVDISSAAPFLIYYPSFTYPALDYYGLPNFNFLPTELYYASNVSITDSHFTGWFSSNLNFGLPITGNVLMWNSTSILVAHNDFLGMGTSMEVYGGSGNLIWGNYFEQSSVIGNPGAMAFGVDPVGLTIYSSNNTIFNNNFNVLLTVISLDYNIYNGGAPVYNNTFNVSSEPSSTVTTFNGQSLSGSVVNNGYVSGNVYWDEIPGQPYNDSGLMQSSYDYSPVTPNMYNVTVTINGNQGSSAEVYLVQNGLYQYIFVNSGTSPVTVPAFNGTYYIVVITNGNFFFDYHQTVTVNGAATNVTVNA